MQVEKIPDVKNSEMTETNKADDDTSAFPVSVEIQDIYIDPQKEAAALRKFDKFLLPVAFLFLTLSSLDRSNVGNAVVFGFSTDLGLKGNMFGNLNTVLYVGLVVFEVPWVMAIKRWGPNKALGTALVCWSILTLGTAFIHNYSQAIALRFLLGSFEAGVSPGFAYLFSTIYPKAAAGKRIMMGNLANCVAGSFGGLFAYGVQSMGERRGIAPWRWLFIVEFCLTLVVGGACWLILPTSPDTAWFLNAEEKETMQLRKQRDAAFRGKDKFDFKWVRLSLLDPFVWLADVAFFTSSVAITGFGVFLPTIIKGLGYASIRVNYMTIPVYVLGAICLLTNCYFSDKLQRRAVFLMGCAVPVAIGYLICVGTANAHAGYAGMFVLVMGVYTISTLVVTWVGTNMLPDAKRAVALPFFYSIGNLSALVSSQLYPSQEGPRYVKGNAISAGLDAVACGLYFSCWFVLRRRNQKKAKLIAEGATTNGHEGDRGLDYMYGL